jgi:hypothetical protein
VTPLVIAILLAAGLLALLPTRRLATRTDDRWIVAGWYVALWATLVALALIPSLRRFAIPVALVLAIGPWLTLRAGIERLLGRPPRDVRPPPRNVTPPDP